jgi:hypothetical protein
MAKYGKTAQKKVAKAMRERKRGTLRSGAKSKKKVTSRKQAIAIGLSEARRAGAKVPRKKTSSRSASNRSNSSRGTSSRSRSASNRSSSSKSRSASSRKTSSRKSPSRKTSSSRARR